MSVYEDGMLFLHL